MISEMEDHRRNAWYALGLAPLTAGGALAVGWLIAVDSHPVSGRPSYWSTPFFVALGLIVSGGIIVTLIMGETWPFRFRRAQHEVAVADLSEMVVTYDGEIVPRSQASSQGSKRRAKNLSEVSKRSEFADDPISDGSEITVDFDALQPMPSEEGKRSEIGVGKVSEGRTESTLPPHGPVPDFSSEYRRFDEIDRHYQASDDWDDACYQWIDDVRAKLEAWNPRFAQRFDAVDFQDMLGPVIHMGRPDIDENPALKELHLKRDRIRRMLGKS